MINRMLPNQFEMPGWDAVRPVADWLQTGLKQHGGDFVRVRQHLHAHPELSGQERETTAFLALELDNTGLRVRKGRDDLGLIADLDVGRPGVNTPLIAVRADIDALPLPDRKQRNYSSRRANVNHACGHDAHAAIAVGTARIFSVLNESRTSIAPDFSARLRFIFQPAEETCEGAQWMIEQGALDGVDAIVGLHLEPQLRAGQVGIRYGVMTAYCDEIAIQIEGRGGHSARPHHTTDPVAAVGQLISSLYALLPRTVDARDATVFSIGRISGGNAPNIIPDSIELAGTLRTTNPDSRGRLKKRIHACCAAIAEATGNTISVQFARPLIAVVNDADVTEIVRTAAVQAVSDENVTVIDKPSLGGEDFALYVDQVPGCMFRLGCAGGDNWPPLHSPVFDIDNACLAIGSEVFSRSILLLSQSLRN